MLSKDMFPVVHCDRLMIRRGLIYLSTKTVISQRGFHIAAPTIWNSIPHEIRSVPLLSTLRRQLKTLFYCQAFN